MRYVKYHENLFSMLHILSVFLYHIFECGKLFKLQRTNTFEIGPNGLEYGPNHSEIGPNKVGKGPK